MILIISQEKDATATFVQNELLKKGVPFLRLNTEKVSVDWRISWSSTDISKAVFLTPDSSVSFESIRAVWYRRPIDPAISDHITNISARKFALNEWKAFLAGIWHFLKDRGAIWVDYPDTIRSASRKPSQLAVARNLGFNVPDTLFTNDRDQVLDFSKGHKNGIVFKAFHQTPLESSAGCFFAYTGFLSEEKFEELDSLRFAPTLFQEYIRPKTEVRVTVIGSNVFAAKCHVDVLDWRRVWVEDQNWSVFSLSDPIAANCRKLVQAFGLNFGAIDLIQTDANEFYFLEMNPSGQWVWLELITEQKMCNSLIELLTPPTRTPVAS